jgi:hypothetical protein
MILTPSGSLTALTLLWGGTFPVYSLLDGAAKSSAAIAPVKTALAFFVSSLLQRIEPLGVVDHGSDAVRELLHGVEG